MKNLLIFYAKRLALKGFFPGTSGNITMRLPDNTILITPSGKAKDLLITEDIVRTDLYGNVLEGNRKPSSEIKMHLYIYKMRKDVNAIVHSHPVFTVAACCSGGIKSELLAESSLIFGKIPLARFASPSTDGIADSISQFVEDSNAFLLANHGGVTLGKDIEEASNRNESLEALCKVSAITNMLGKPIYLTEDELKELYDTH